MTDPFIWPKLQFLLHCGYLLNDISDETIHKLDISDSDCVRKFTYNSLVLDLLTTFYLPMHATVAGSGVHVPFGDTPSDVHTAVLLPVGTNPVLHLKIISVPPSVFGTAIMEPS